MCPLGWPKRAASLLDGNWGSGTAWQSGFVPYFYFCAPGGDNGRLRPMIDNNNSSVKGKGDMMNEYLVDVAEVSDNAKVKEALRALLELICRVAGRSRADGETIRLVMECNKAIEAIEDTVMEVTL